MRKLIALMLLLGCGSIQAEQITANFDFTIEVLDETDAFVTKYGLADDLIVNGQAVYSDASLTGIDDELIIFEAPDAFLINIGTLSLNASDDVDFGSGFAPGARYFDGEFQEFEFFYEETIGSTTYGVGLFEEFEIGEDNIDMPVVIHTGLINVDFVSAVPIPSAVWLFGSGLIGLIGLARRKANA